MARKTATRSHTQQQQQDSISSPPDRFAAKVLEWVGREMWDWRHEFVTEIGDEEAEDATIRDPDEPTYDQVDEAERDFVSKLPNHLKAAFEAYDKTRAQYDRYQRRVAFQYGIALGRRIYGGAR